MRLTTESSNPSVAVEIMESIAELEGSDPTTLPPLFGTVDPDALDALCDGTTPSLTISFDYLGYGVTVDGDRNVTVE